MEEQGTGTILEYARTQTRDFTEFPFQTADALVFALLLSLIHISEPTRLID